MPRLPTPIHSSARYGQFFGVKALPHFGHVIPLGIDWLDFVGW